MNLRVGVLATLVLVSSPAGAQSIDRLPRPVAPAPTPFRFPRVIADSLPNGLRIFVVEDHSVPVVAVRAVLAADSSRDPVGKEGVSRLMIDALREGTTRRTADQLAEAGAAIGTAITPVSFTTTTASFAPALDIMAEMLMHPSFDSAGVERRKAQALALVRNTLQAPATPARRLFYTMVLGAADAQARQLAATVAGTSAITRADVVRAYEENVGPRTTAIVVTGDVSPKDVVARVSRVFGAWASSARRSVVVSVAEPIARPTTIYLHDTPGTDALIYVGNLGPLRSSQESFAADVMASVVNTRVQAELRDRRSFMYQGTSGYIWRQGSLPAVFVGSTNVSPVKVDSALGEWLGLLRRLRTTEPVTAAELDAGVRRLVGPLPSRIDGADGLANTVAELVRDNLGTDYRERYARALTGLTAADVNAAAQRLIDLDHLVIVVSGNRQILEPALRAANLAPVVVVDASGKPLNP